MDKKDFLADVKMNIVWVEETGDLRHFSSNCGHSLRVMKSHTLYICHRIHTPSSSYIVLWHTGWKNILKLINDNWN